MQAIRTRSGAEESDHARTQTQDFPFQAQQAPRPRCAVRTGDGAVSGVRRAHGAPSRLPALRPVPRPAGRRRARLSRATGRPTRAEQMNGALADQVALVTGASRGSGRAIPRRLAAAGARVHVNFVRDVAAGEETVAMVRAAGGTAELARFDIADAGASSDAIGAIVKSAGRLDILVNNAGLAI